MTTDKYAIVKRVCADGMDQGYGTHRAFSWADRAHTAFRWASHPGYHTVFSSADEAEVARAQFPELHDAYVAETGPQSIALYTRVVRS